KEGKLEVLVATDVAARGLDVDDLPLVVNYELPHVPEDYIHRIGRTGRAGAIGEAISFVAPEEEKYLSEIERLLKKKIDIVHVDGFDPVAAAARSESPKSRVSRARSTDERASPRREPAARREPATPRHEPATPRHEPATPRQEPAASRRAPTRSTREIEREEAYARNPDQPLPSPSADAQGEARSALVHGAGHGRKDKARPIPALLMKRKAPETEDA
ncbi:MAG: helicase-related protein, partial [Casimicrobiaceae bacterium]